MWPRKKEVVHKGSKILMRSMVLDKLKCDEFLEYGQVCPDPPPS